MAAAGVASPMTIDALPVVAALPFLHDAFEQVGAVVDVAKTESEV